MKKYILLYKGPATPPDASHAGWPEWFQKIGDALVDQGSPMVDGMALGQDATRVVTPTSLNGYSIIQAEDANHARELIQDHPYLQDGAECVIEVFELPAK